MSKPLLLLVTLLALLSVRTAEAAFAQATCATTPNFDPRFAVRFGAEEFDRRPIAPPGSANDFVFYNNNTQPGYMTLLTNANVFQIQPQYGFFVTEPNFDYVEVVDNLDNVINSFRYTGTLNTSTTTEVPAGRVWQPFQDPTFAQFFLLRFFTDVSVASQRPPVFSGVRVSCKTTQTTTHTSGRSVSLNSRTDGLLLKTGDVIYVQATQPANTPLVMSLDTKTGTDFDLYASFANPQPDDASFDFRGFSATPNEAFEIPASSVERTIFIGVHSFSGAGHFSLNVMAQHPSQRMSLRVCPLNFTPTSDQRVTIVSFLRSGSARLLAASNGNQFQRSFTLQASQTSCNDGCDICLQNDTSGTATGGTRSGHVCGQTSFGGGVWGAGAARNLVYQHEMGHACYGLPDEYTGPPSGSSSNTLCGHSEMNNSGIHQSFCSITHCSDGHTFDSTQCNGDSNWKRMEPRIFFGAKYGSSNTSALPMDFTQNVNLLNIIRVN